MPGKTKTNRYRRERLTYIPPNNSVYPQTILTLVIDSSGAIC